MRVSEYLLFTDSPPPELEEGSTNEGKVTHFAYTLIHQDLFRNIFHSKEVYRT